MAWHCPTCKRKFGKPNQHHMCGQYDMDALFEGKPDEFLLIFDKLLVELIDLPEMAVGASVNTIIFTSKTTFLVVRPMSKLMDIKFYTTEELQHPLLFKSGEYRGKYYYHIRVASVEELTADFFKLIQHGYRYSMR